MKCRNKRGQSQLIHVQFSVLRHQFTPKYLSSLPLFPNPPYSSYLSFHTMAQFSSPIACCHMYILILILLHTSTTVSSWLTDSYFSSHKQIISVSLTLSSPAHCPFFSLLLTYKHVKAPSCAKFYKINAKEVSWIVQQPTLLTYFNLLGSGNNITFYSTDNIPLIMLKNNICHYQPSRWGGGV